MKPYAYSADLQSSITRPLFENPWLIETSDVRMHPAGAEHLDALVNLYENAYLRGDWFGDRSCETEPRTKAERFVRNALDLRTITLVAFTTDGGLLLGATLLDFDTANGVLIDETQIDPVLGRRRGIMSAYFRRVVPLLAAAAPYWTEFILTPESRVLRRALITELGMVVTGLKPSSHRSTTVGKTRSALLAEGAPAARVDPFAPFSAVNPAEVALLNALTECGTNTNVGMASGAVLADHAFTERLVEIADLNERQMLFEQGWLPIGVSLHNQQFLYAIWPSLEQGELDFTKNENIKALSALVDYLQNVSSMHNRQ